MITREDMIEQSVTDLAREILTTRGYTDDLEFVESFDDVPRDVMRTNYVAVGFNFDDEGEAAECGSDLRLRTYSHQFFVFGMTHTYARNIAQVLKFGFDRDEGVPLKDISQDGAPEIDVLTVLGVTAERQIVPDPEPWQRNVWTTTLRVEDEYSASLA